MNRRTGGRADERTSGQSDGRTIGLAGSRTVGQSDERTGGPRAASGMVLAVLLLAAVARPAEAQDWRDRLRRVVSGAAQVVQTLLPISTDKEIEIGRGIAATIAGRYPIAQSEALTMYVNLVGLTVAGEAPRPDITYRFAVLETPDVNAFAAPGGYIFVTRGALNLMESESELAGVLAHEVGHVNRRHVIEGIRKADFMHEVRDQAGISGATLDRAVGAGSNVLFSGYSRQDEAEADSLGVLYAASAGYEAAGLPTFVSHLGSHAREGPLAEITATHEPPAARIQRLQRIIEANHISGGERLDERFAQRVRGQRAAAPITQPPAAQPPAAQTGPKKPFQPRPQTQTQPPRPAAPPPAAPTPKKPE
jgi:beta-barrel assembly-enhancing protease